MSGAENRFRRLDPPKRQNGDLFEHFGVRVGPTPAGSVQQVPNRAAAVCPACGWYQDPEAACDNCGRGAEPE